MSDYQSFQTYQAPQQDEAPQTLRPQIDADAGQTTSVVIRNGVAVAEHSSSMSVRSSELNPYAGDGSVFASARSATGIAVQEITPETLITIAGVQSSVKFFQREGLVHQGADGSWQEGPGAGAQEAPQAAPVESTEDALSMPGEIASAVDSALDGVSDANLTPLVGIGIGVATGEVDRGRLEATLQRMSGATPEEAAARVSLMQAAYQAQVDTAITSRTGVAEADLAGFYEWAKASQGGALRGAIEAQVHRNSFAGFRSLAARYLAECPPSLTAVKAAGIESRQHGDTAEIRVQGRWITLATAARLGLI